MSAVRDGSRGLIAPLSRARTSADAPRHHCVRATPRWGSATVAMALPLLVQGIMPPEPDVPSDTSAPRSVVYQFTVLRGMAVALVIETPDWYSGLVQAALARIRLDGCN
jgi:hypothetical protein